MGDQGNKPFRYTRGKLSVETTLFLILLGWSWKATTWWMRRIKPIWYHPTALTGCAIALAAYITSPLLLAWLLEGVLVWYVVHPASYRKHARPRIESFKAGWYYRHRPRRKLTACSLLNDKDPVPTISTIQKIGCTTKMRLKMVDGDEINMWRVQSARLAQTYNALDCKINPYRRQTLNPFKKELVTKPRWLVLDFLTKDPFNSGLGVEYLDYHNQTETSTPVIAVNRDGSPERDDLAAHKLDVAMTQWGKSTRIRVRIYAHRDKIRRGELELWGIDGKGGIEQSFLQHLFARVAYGDTQANPNTYNPAQFDRLLKDAVLVLKRRQRKMRGNTTHHVATRQDPWLLIIIDELLVLTSKAIDPTLRNSIASNINLIKEQGLACGVTIDASTQFATKDILGNIERGGFTQFELGKVEQGAVDMIFGTGWWERGAKADEIADDLKGVRYKKTHTTMAPTQIRYPNITVDDVSEKNLGFHVEKSVLWPLPRDAAKTNGHRKAKVPQHAYTAPQGAPQPNGQHPTGENGQTDPQPAEEAIPSSKEVQDYIGGFA